MIDFFCEDKIIKIATGGYHFCIMTSSQKMYSWGTRNNKCQFGVPCVPDANTPTLIPIQKELVISVNCSYYSSFCVTRSGDLYAAGDNRVSQCGLSGTKFPLLQNMTLISKKSISGKINFFPNSRNQISFDWNLHFRFLPSFSRKQVFQFFLCVKKKQKLFQVIPKPIMRLILFHLFTQKNWWKQI